MSQNKYTIGKIKFILFFYLTTISIIILAQKPVANFSNDNSNGCGYIVINFTDQSTNTPDSWLWKIYQTNGIDTLKSTLQNPVFALYSNGNYNVSLTASNKSGISTILKKSLISVYKVPSANFTTDKTNFCINELVNFKYTSASGDAAIQSWYWDFGDGNFSTKQNPTYSYSNAGTYRVSLLVKDIHGCENEYRNFSVNIISNPSVKFTVPAVQACLPPAMFNFTNTSQGSGLIYQWKVNGINVSTAQNLNYIFKNSGYFDVSLTATNSDGCFDSIYKKNLIQINTYYDTIAANIHSGCVPLSVSFTDKTDAGAKTWKWYFGDGDSSTVQSPTHIYKKQGSYTVILKTTNAFGCLNTKIISNYINAYEANVQFAMSDSISCSVPFKIDFINKSSNIKSCVWDFGDGNKDTVFNPTHLYLSVNSIFSVGLTIKDINGCSASLVKQNIIKITKPSIQMNASINQGCVPLNVTFTDNTSSSAPLVKWKWYFGDGSTSNLQNPTHIFNDTGVFNVALVVKDLSGCGDSVIFMKLIKTGASPKIDFMTNDTLGCLQYKVNFKNNTQFADQFLWNFGDGTTGTIIAPSHTYSNQIGYVDVKLVASQNGCKDSLTKIKYIQLLAPIPGFKILTPTSCNIPFTAVFLNTSKYATSTIWDFKDGTPIVNSMNDTIKHTFTTRGIHPIELTAINSISVCQSKQKQSVIISDVKPGFKQDLASVCMYNSINFTDTSYTNTGLKLWSWDFGDGTKSTTTKTIISHKYSKSGQFKVSLIVTDQINCKDTIIKNSVIVNKLPSPRFSADKTDGCAPLTVAFKDGSFIAPPSVIKKWSWSFGDNSTSTTQNPSHLYKLNGKFTVSLKVTDSLGCDSSLTKTYFIKPTLPVANFTLNKLFNLSDTLTCFPDSAHFKNNSTGVNLNYVWSFGDGSQNSNLINPVHNFVEDSTKIFKVSLTVSDVNSCVSSYSRNITISRPIARFNGDPRYIDCPYPIKYFKVVNNSTKDASKWSWNFGDTASGYNNFSVINNPQHSYRNAGYYDVSLAIRNKFGCYDSIMKKQYVFVDGPSGTFKFTTKIGCPPLQVNFLANSINTDNFLWIFGDGNSLETKSDSISHIYLNGDKVIYPSLILERISLNGNLCQLPVLTTNSNGQRSDSIKLFPSPKTNAGPDKEICIGESVSITATGGLTYQWNNSKLTDVITEKPIVSTNFIVTAFNQYCSSSDTMKVIVNPLPLANAGKDTSVCKGMKVKLTASGGVGYSWSENATTTQDLTVSPSEKTKYSVTVTDIKGCKASDDIFVSIRDSLKPTISGKNEFCNGDSTQLVVSKCGTKYQWNTGETKSVVNTHGLKDNKKYTVTVTDDLGCTGVAGYNITVNQYPIANAGNDTSICKGDIVNLIANGNGTYLWNNNKITKIITEKPLNTSTYTLTVNSKGCSTSDTVIVFVNQLPIAEAGKDTAVCKGVSTNLIASGGTKYKWNVSNANNPILTIQPIKKSTFIVTVTDSNGCSAMDSVLVTIKDSLHPTITGKNEFCSGDSTRLIVNNCGTHYIWNNGDTFKVVNTSGLTDNAKYIVTVTDDVGCSGIAEINITVNKYPEANAGIDTTICRGNIVNLSVTGNGTYQWNNNKTTKIIAEQPLFTTTYFVAVSNNGCKTTDSVTVFVNQLPIAEAGKDTAVCKGVSTNLIASGGIKYKWNIINADSSVLAIQPTKKTMFIVTVTDGNGCSAMDSVLVTIKDSLHPSITGKKEFCSGDSTVLKVNTTGNKFIWNSGENTAEINTSALFNDKKYFITVSDDFGCTGVTDIIVKVNPLPIADAGKDVIICLGKSTTLSAKGGFSYKWNNGTLTIINTVSPVNDIQYVVTVTDLKGCSSKDSVNVFVKNNPILYVQQDTTICSGTKIILKASGSDRKFAWNIGDTSSTITVSPIKLTSYIVTMFNSFGCSTNAEVKINTMPLPETPEIPSELICFGKIKIPEDALLSIMNPLPSNKYQWFATSTGGNIINEGTSMKATDVLSSETFYVEATAQNGCKSSTRAKAKVIAGNKPQADFSFDTILPPTELGVIKFNNFSEPNNGKGDLTYIWNFGNGEGSSVDKDPSYTYRDTGNFEVELIIRNTDQCVDTIKKHIRILNMLSPWIPDAFTPNGDLHNDKLFVRGPLKYVNFEVYNQFGFKVFQSNDQTIGWDGTYKGNNEPEGNYSWNLQGLTNDGHPVNAQGYVVLLR